MNKIFIKKINVQNFGGVVNGSYEFTPETNVIEITSGGGKTTAYFAYLWALGFTIPTWEPQIDGYRLYKAKTEVVVELDVNGTTYTLSKTNTPKYKINKFTAEEEYVGTDFKYIFDGQECGSYAEYKERVTDIFGVDYFTLELLSNISLFNGEDNKRWNKEERRKYLFKLFDLENKIKELGNEQEFACLKEYIDKGKDELAINQILNTLKTDIDNEVKRNQTIIEEKQGELANYTSIDFDDLETRKNKLANAIDELLLEQKESAKNSVYTSKKEKLSQLMTERDKIVVNNNNLMQDWNRRVAECEQANNGLDMDIAFAKSAVETFYNQLATLNSETVSLNEAVFDETQTICPTCKQQLPTTKIEQLIKDFENNKNKRLAEIAQKVEICNSKREDELSRLNTLQEQKIANTGHLNELQDNKPTETNTQELEEQIKSLQDELKNIDTTNVEKEFSQKISMLKLDYENVVKELAKKEILDQIRNRIEELKSRIRELGLQDSLRVEKKNALQKYTQRKVSMINEEINKNFEGVRYNFFKWNASSSSATKDYMEVCNAVLAETGVEYEALSSGQKVKVDLYTNNSLRKILGVCIPQFVDDVVLSDLEQQENNWQSIYLLTNNSIKPKVTLLRDVYSLQDCDVRENK